MGVFVLITSVNPLRIYKYDEILLRFCPKKYHPFDEFDVRKYVVEDGHKSFYEMDSFGDDFNKYSAKFKDLFENHLVQNGRNVSRMWEQIDDAIVSITRTSEEKFIEEVCFLNFSKFYFKSINFPR